MAVYNKSGKLIKSSANSSNPYGFYINNETIYDKYGNYWTMCDYFTAPPDMIVEPYKSFDEAEKDMRFHIEDGLSENEVGGDFDDYCYEFTKFAEENVPYYIIESSHKPIKSSVDKQRVKEELNYPYYNIENPERFYDIQFDINWEDIPAFATSWNKCIDIDPKEIVSVEYDDSVPASYQDVNNMDYDAIDGAYLVKFKDGTSKSYGWTYGGDKLKLMSSVHSSRKPIKSEKDSDKLKEFERRIRKVIGNLDDEEDLIQYYVGRYNIPEDTLDEIVDKVRISSSRKPIKSSNLIKSNVEIDDDIFIELLWDRVNSFTPAKGYDDEFWTECFDYLSETGWMGDPWKNDPKYIVDNIAVNGQIFALEDCVDNYDEINDDYEGDVNAWIEDNGYLVFGDYVVINLGL